MLHFDNAPVYNTEGLQESLANFGFRRMEPPRYRPDLALCDFFLFGAMKQAFAGQYFDVTAIFLCVWRHLWEGFLRTSSRPFVRNEYGDSNDAMRAVENALSEHC
jgi:hypothetical protein